MADFLLFNLIVLAVFAADVFTNNLVDELFAAVELNCALAVATVPESIVELFAVWRFVVYKEHILLFAGNIGYHTVSPGLLLYVPYNLCVSFLAIKLCARKRPEF